MAKRFSKHDPKIGDITDLPEREVVARFIYNDRKFYVSKENGMFVVVEIVSGTKARKDIND